MEPAEDPDWENIDIQSKGDCWREKQEKDTDLTTK